MREFVLNDERLREILSTVLPHLDERQRRILAGTTARHLGRGGVTAVSEAAGMSRSTVQAAVVEVDAGLGRSDRVRRAGGGRPRLTDKEPLLLEALWELMEPRRAGGPPGPLRWTCRSTRQLARTLQAMGHTVSVNTVRALLLSMGFSFGATAPFGTDGDTERDEQLRHLSRQVEEHVAARQPVVSLTTSEVELSAGEDGGSRWPPDHLAARRAVPGSGSEQAEAIRRWWRIYGRRSYAGAACMVVATVTAGRPREPWNAQLTDLAAETSLDIVVHHFPPATTRWETVEQRLLSSVFTRVGSGKTVRRDVQLDVIGPVPHGTAATPYPAGRHDRGAEPGPRAPLDRGEHRQDWNYTIVAPRVAMDASGSGDDGCR